ncbi:MAG: queuosine precursor transporter [Bacteroidaceae bacterium]|nr:queuosine precursor transporter [Bacteroidaceae bacterium]
MGNKSTKVSVFFMHIGVLFTVCLIASNVLETKQIDVLGLPLTGGLLVFPISYIINDVVSEVWGYRKAGILIWTGFAMNFFFVSVCALCDAIPGAPFWDNDAGFHAIFGLTPRIAAASFVSFIAGSFVNAYVMSKMKISSGGKNFSLRAVVSTIFGEGVDSLLFFPLALYGVVPDVELPMMMLLQVVLKTGYEIVVLPITNIVVRWVKKYEGEDVYDNGISYNILKIWKNS